MKFALQQPLRIKVSQQTGECTARAEYINTESTYRLHYLDTQGNPRTDWFDESLLESIEVAGVATE